MAKIVIVNGYPGSGKTTWERMCTDILKSGQLVSTVDWVKEIYKYIGWNGEKTPESRKFLSDFKQFLIQHGDLVFKNMVEKIAYIEEKIPTTKVIFVDSREPAEIQRFVDEYQAVTVFIDRGQHDEISNDSDKNVENYHYDFTVHNDGSIYDLFVQAQHFCRLYFKSN